MFFGGNDLDFNDLKQSCLSCTKCNLCATRKNVVFGIGNSNAKVLFIGEGPGENEDIQGEPFVGRGGQLLDKMLKVIDLDRKRNIYIANMVKCRPPMNRDPSEDEISQCKEWLEAQIEYINPKIIVCLGRIAALKYIDSNFKVTKEHGNFYNINGRLVMGTFHPAALLRNPNNKPDAMEDFFALKRKINEICPETYSDNFEEDNL